MNKKIFLSLLPILLSTGFAGRAEAYTALGEVGQSTDVGVYLYGGDSAPTAAGDVFSSISGTVSDPGYAGSSSTFNSQARATHGEVGTYAELNYSNGGGYQVRAEAYSGDILEFNGVANSTIDFTFDAVVHGAMTGSGSGIFGNTLAQLAYGEYGGTPTLGGVPGWYYGPSAQMDLINDNIVNGVANPGSIVPTFTYTLTLDGSGHGSVAALLSMNSLITTGGAGWSTSSSGSTLADYLNTVSITVSTQSATTTITSQGGWNVVNNSPITAVPEPETYAMLLAGLGLLGFIGQRRKNLAG